MGYRFSPSANRGGRTRQLMPEEEWESLAEDDEELSRDWLAMKRI
jgi:hypothetical protein